MLLYLNLGAWVLSGNKTCFIDFIVSIKDYYM